MEPMAFKRFVELSRSHTLIPLVKSVPADLYTPVSAFLSVARDERHAVLLESVEKGEQIGRYSFIGIRPFCTIKSDGEGSLIRRGGRERREKVAPLDYLQKTIHSQRIAALEGAPPFMAGAIGYVSYDAVRSLEDIGSRTANDLGIPDCYMMLFDRLLAFDHVRHSIQIVATANVENRSPKRAFEMAMRDLRRIEKQLERGLRLDASRRRRGVRAMGAIKPGMTRRAFTNAAGKIRKYIAAGDVFQVVLSRRVEFEPGVESFEVYRALRALNPSPYLYYMKMPEFDVLGASPEMLIRARGRRLEYRPIAGTRARGVDVEDDRRLELELLSDEKERSEHIMLLDLGRNDLGRVSKYGSVAVKHRMFCERYSHVMHLVSAIEGELKDGLTALDAFKACFPAGTLTGAPKVRAMQIIEELEPTRRGLYGGAILYADFAGNLDSCIAIRTLLMKGKRAYLQAGAGIVADSVAEKEFEECENKAKALVNAVRVARGEQARAGF